MIMICLQVEPTITYSHTNFQIGEVPNRCIRQYAYLDRDWNSLPAALFPNSYNLQFQDPQRCTVRWLLFSNFVYNVNNFRFGIEN